MSEVSVVTIGFYHYAIEEDFLPVLLTAVAQGKIRQVEKKYTDGVNKAVVGKAINIEAERCEVVTSRDAELAELKAKLKKLEESNG